MTTYGNEPLGTSGTGTTDPTGTSTSGTDTNGAGTGGYDASGFSSGTTDSSTTDKAKDTASTAADQSKHVAGTAKDEALNVAGTAAEQARNVVGEAKQQVTTQLNDQATTVLVADLGATHGRLAVSTAAGEVIDETVIESWIDKGPSTVLDTVTAELDAMLKRSGRSAETLRGVGVGVPGPVNWHTGRIARSISMPGWDNYPVGDHLASHYSVPAVVDNDANLLGLGEQRRIYPDAHMVLFVKIGTGIGSSMIMDGELLHGSDSAEGDIGHAKIIGVEETCSSCR